MYRNALNQLTIFLPEAIKASKEAGDVILEVYNSDFIVTKKEDESPLTIADQRAHEIIAQRLKNTAFPILSEEGRDIPYDIRKEWEYFWLVDPLDGTKEFINRNGEFTVNIALIRRNRPVIGVVYIPVSGIAYYAMEGIGSYKMSSSFPYLLSSPLGGEDKSLPPKYLSGGEGDSSPQSLEIQFKALLKNSERLPLKMPERPFTVVGSRSHMNKETEDYINKLKQRCGEIEFISAGSSLKFCLVAEGRADIYPRFGPTMEWDTAAGQCIVEATGGMVTSLTGERLCYNKPNLLNPYFAVSGKHHDASLRQGGSSKF